MAYGLPTHGQQNWDDEVNNSIDAVKSMAQQAQSTADGANTSANTAANSAAAAKAKADQAYDLASRGVPGPTGPAGPAGADGRVTSIVAGTNIAVDSTDPGNPIVSATLSTGVSSVNGYTGTVNLTNTDVGAAATSHTHAEADITGLAADLAAKVPTTRSVGTGSGLTGGGDLSADRTLAVSFGTAAGTVAEGSDSRITGAAQKANNLSDLPSAATARTNLGLGTAATANTGTGAANVILGNDSRLTDARTPTAHKSTHATGGMDALVPTDIGAASRTQGGHEATKSPTATTGTVTLDCSQASIFTISPTGAITLSPSNVPASGTGCTITIVVSQGATAQTVTLMTGGVWLGSTPTQTANKACVITAMTTNGGTTWYCSGVVQA